MRYVRHLIDVNECLKKAHKLNETKTEYIVISRNTDLTIITLAVGTQSIHSQLMTQLKMIHPIL